MDAFDHVAYGFDGAEGVVGDLDAEGFLDFEGDVDLVEGIDVELVEGALEGDGVLGNGLGFGDDLDTALGDVFHDGAAFLFSSNYRDACVSVKAACGLGCVKRVLRKELFWGQRDRKAYPRG